MNKITASTTRINLSRSDDNRLIFEHVLKNAHNSPTIMQNDMKLSVITLYLKL